MGLVEVEFNESGWFGSAKMHKGMIGDDHVPVCNLFPHRHLRCQCGGR